MWSIPRSSSSVPRVIPCFLSRSWVPALRGDGLLLRGQISKNPFLESKPAVPQLQSSLILPVKASCLVLFKIQFCM